jgi:hypothetical protein
VISDPVLSELEREIEAWRHPSSTVAHLAVVRYGRPYVGVERPRGYRQRARKQCFRNAGLLAFDDRGTYVEGFVLPIGGTKIHHAWVSLDGVHAIDPTLPNASACRYFGIPFPVSALKRVLQERRYWGPILSTDFDIGELMRL